MQPPILRDIKSELETTRLILRAPRFGDGTTIYEAVLESIGQLRQWPASLPWAVAEPSVAASETFCREAIAGFAKRTSLPYLVFERETGSFVASTSLHDINWHVPRFELGFWCRTGKQRRGYMKEALLALLEYAFSELGARRVDAITDEQNLASKRLCQSIGMHVEGVHENAAITPSGELRNSCTLAIVR